MGPQVEIGHGMYQLEHYCHFGPMLGSLRSGAGPSVLALIVSGLGWALFGYKGPPRPMMIPLRPECALSCLIWGLLVSRQAAPGLKVKNDPGVGPCKPNFLFFSLLNGGQSTNSGPNPISFQASVGVHWAYSNLLPLGQILGYVPDLHSFLMTVVFSAARSTFRFFF